ncbi:MAG TPA: ATP-binding cassette domain-containing protein [Candidatus Limnocylindria bacterium]|nr:ATP-binding cassette domain-containing protein [Candidatus Limnocylindria bacterium]
MPKTAIVVKDLHKSFGKLKVLEGVNLTVETGNVFALLGPNGAGKTTIVRVLSTLLKADSGTIKVNGFDVHESPAKVREVIGLTGQYAAVDEYLSGRENLEMMGRLYRLSKQDAAKRAQQLLEQFDLVKAADRIAKNYSGGMRRRLDLAASLIATPPILFLDEPTTGLDPRSRIAMWDIIKNLVAQGTTILLTTQYLEEADLLADKIVVIDGGKVIAEGTADQLKQKVGNERLELTISEKSNFSKAKQIVDGEALQVDEDQRKLSIANNGGATQVKNLLIELEKAKITVETLALHKPTLDDVFLTLTGKQTADSSQETEPEDEPAGRRKK